MPRREGAESWPCTHTERWTTRRCSRGRRRNWAGSAASRCSCLIGLAASAAIGAVGLAFGKPLVEPGVIWQSYLIAYIFWIGLTLGSLAVLMIQHLTGGAWTFPSRRILEAATRNLPLMAVLFIPIAMNLPALYKWAQPVERCPKKWPT